MTIDNAEATPFDRYSYFVGIVALVIGTLTLAIRPSLALMGPAMLFGWTQMSTY